MRVDLAAAHRLAELFGWTQLIYNHFTHRVPGEPHHFLVKPHEWMFREVTASSLIKIDLDGQAVDPNPSVNAAGFAIHTAVLKARPDVQAILHIHTDAGIAISAHKDGLRFMSQAAMRFYGCLSYHEYHGIAELEESESIARDLRQSKAMILRNHGLLTVGRGIAEAMSRMNYLMSAFESQLKLEATGVQNILLPPPAVCERAAQQYPNRPIHIINPFAAGGSGDIVTRIVTQKISENTGKIFVLEGKTGAAGRIGYEAGVRAVPDGLYAGPRRHDVHDDAGVTCQFSVAHA